MANTDLIARYVAAVKFWLPKRLADDVAAELADDIQSEVDEAEKAKGCPLSEDEVATLLKARGNPLSVAGRYLPKRHLIGPELFPLYVFVLKIVAVICIVVPVVNWILRASLNRDLPLPGDIASPFNSLMLGFAVVTIVFAVIEYKGINIAKQSDWSPKTLRPVVDHNRIPRGDSVGEIIGALVGIWIYSAGYLSQTSYHLGGGASIGLAPEWIGYWQIVIALAAFDVALGAVNLFKPYWSVPRVLANFVLNLAKVAASWWLFQAHLVRQIEGLPDRLGDKILLLSDKLADYAGPVCALMTIAFVAGAAWRLAMLARRRAFGTQPT